MNPSLTRTEVLFATTKAPLRPAILLSGPLFGGTDTSVPVFNYLNSMGAAVVVGGVIRGVVNSTFAYYMKSTDGSEWTAVCLSGMTITALMSNGSVALAVSGSSVSQIMRATGTDEWAGYGLPSVGVWKKPVWTGSVFVTVKASSSEAATSPDGITWTARTMSSSRAWTEPRWNGSLIVVSSGTTTYATSPDGITWTDRTAPVAFSQVETAGPNTYWHNGTTLYSSSDAISWGAKTFPVSFFAWQYPKYNGSVYYTQVRFYSNAMRSTDGTTWTDETAPISSWDTSFFLIGNKFCIVPGNGGAAVTSSDAITWANVASPGVESRKYVFALGAYTYVSGSLGLRRTNTDGVSWEVVSHPSNTVSPTSYKLEVDDYTGTETLFALCTLADSTTLLGYSYDNGVSWSTSLLPDLTNFSNQTNGYPAEIRSIATNRSPYFKYYAVANRGYAASMAFSTDLVNWTISPLTDGQTEYSSGLMEYTNSIFCVIGGISSAMSWAGSYGSSGTRYYPAVPIFGNATGLFAANGVFLATNGGYGLYRSTDGATWTATSGTGTNLEVHAGSAGFKSGSAFSTHALTWVAGSVSPGNYLSAATEKNGVYYALSSDFDGVAWRARARISNDGMRAFSAVFDSVLPANPYDGQVGVCTADDTNIYMFLGRDRYVGVLPPSDWEAKQLDVRSVTCGAYNGTVFCLAGSYTYAATISADGETWGSNTMMPSSDYSCGTALNGTFYFTTWDSGDITISTNNGDNWSVINIPSLSYAATITSGGGKVCVVGYNAVECAVSTDGVIWVEGTLPAAHDWFKSTYGNGVFVVVSDGDGAVAVSPDGLIWEVNIVFPGAADGFSGVACKDGLFSAVTYNGIAYTSTDGKDWTYRADTGFFANGVLANEDFFIAFGPTSEVAVSRDGVTWTIEDSLLGSGYINSGVVSDDGLFVLTSYTSYAVIVGAPGSNAGLGFWDGNIKCEDT